MVYYAPMKLQLQLDRPLVVFDIESTGVNARQDRISWFNCHDEARREVAAAGRAAYRRQFDARRVLKYMVETTRGEPHSEPYEWAEEVYR